MSNEIYLNETLSHVLDFSFYLMVHYTLYFCADIG